MNVLIVDDQIDVVKGVVAGVDWEQVLVAGVFTANSMKEAQQVFAEQPIDILISDIEMPMGSGLDLVAWVRNHHPATECIFLTSHEDFSYARAALQLGSLDYLLQPIKYDELEKAIINAISKVRSRTETEEYLTFGKYWELNTVRLRESFWYQILAGRYQQNKSRLDQIAAQLGLSPKESAEYLPFQISVHRRQVQLSEWDDDLLKHTFVNVLEELIFDKSGILQLVQMDSSHYAILLPLTNDGRIDRRQLDRKLQFFINFSAKHLKCSISCYVGDYVPADQLANLYQKLLDLEKQNIARYDKVFFLNDISQISEDYPFPENPERWIHLLEAEQYDRVADEAEALIKTAVAKGIVDAGFLASVQQKFTALVWKVAQERGVKLQDVLTDPEMTEKYLKCLDSIDDFLAFVRLAAGIPGRQVMNEQDYLTAVEQAKSYIRNNLDRELSRNEIAEKVYLNPEYLSRLFRKHTGITLSEFITSERIRIAKDYLTNTRMPVSIIATKTGYANFSHFSKMFKKSTGLSPNEFRQANQKQS